MIKFLRRYDALPAIVAVGLFSAFGVTACAVNATDGNYTIFGHDTGISQGGAQADVGSALNTACPIIGVLAANPPALSAFQKQALVQLTNACPPNPAPTNIVTAATDILAAYEALAPLVHK